MLHAKTNAGVTLHTPCIAFISHIPNVIALIYRSYEFLLDPCTSCLHTTIDAAATRHVEGRNLFLSCHCPDVPVGVPTRWHRDGHLIERGEATRFLDRLPDVRKLILVPAQINDTGNYSCSVGNATGNSVGIIVMSNTQQSKAVERVWLHKRFFLSRISSSRGYLE